MPVPLVVEPPATSMHRPKARSVPSPVNVHVCAAVLSQSRISKGVPAVLVPPVTAMHRLEAWFRILTPVATGAAVCAEVAGGTGDETFTVGDFPVSAAR